MKESEYDLKWQEFEDKLLSLVKEFKETGDLSREAVHFLADKCRKLIIT
jgi:hypothetical protein